MRKFDGSGPTRAGFAQRGPFLHKSFNNAGGGFPLGYQSILRISSLSTGIQHHNREANFTQG